MENNKENNIENRVMDQIVSGRVKLRSKYIFIAEKLGLESALVLTVILAIIFFNLVLYYLRASDNIQYLSFGSRGLYAFLESFPYLLVVTLIILMVLAGFIIKNSAIAYRKSFVGVLIGLVVVIFLTGTVMAFTDIAERIEEQAYSDKPAGYIFKPFLGHGMGQRNRGEAGVVLEVNGDLLIIQTPAGEHIVNIAKIEKAGLSIQSGNFIVAVGERKQKIFIAEEIQILEQGQMPMLMRGIKRRFGPMPGGMMRMPVIVK